MAIQSSLPAALQGLLSPEAYPHPARDIRVLQTHISYVVIAGDFAYKIKKPVNLGFVDYSTLERRQAMCREEVRLNRRLCVGIYLGVVAITMNTQGSARIGGGGEVLEYAVHMRCVPEDRAMPSLLASGHLTSQHLRTLARRMVDFHSNAGAVADAAYGGTTTIRQNWEENFSQLRPYVGRTIAAEPFEVLESYARTYMSKEEELFVSRASSGCVRDCHGDLRADSVVVWPNGSICIMDCIEFNERLRFCDVASELAFLAMDLESRGYAREADAIVSAYLEHVADETLPVVLNFYRAYRACVRAKVECFLQDDDNVGSTERLAARDRVARYMALALSYVEVAPPCLVVMVGLSGSGKSWVASALAGRISAALVRSDHIRHLIGSEPPRRGTFGEGHYSARERDQVYELMFKGAADHLASGRSVVLDATFLSRKLRARAQEVVARARVRALFVEASAPEEVIRARMSERVGDSGLSDARWDTYVAQREEFESLDNLPPDACITVDTTVSLDIIISKIRGQLLSPGGD